MFSPRGKKLSHWPISTGYVCVSLLGVYLKGGKTVARTVHSLVAHVWIGKRPKGLFVNHKDTNKRNNRKSNLEYVTPQANNLHAVEAGVLPSGEAHYKSTMTKRQVERIWKLIQRGWRNSSIAKRVGVSPTKVANIRIGKSWKSVTGIVRLNDVGNSDSCHHRKNSMGESKVRLKKQVRAIKMISSGNYSRKEIADFIGLSTTMVGSIKRRDTWMEAWKVFDSRPIA